MAAISVASGGNPMVPKISFFSADKLAHLLIFGLLATAFYRAANPAWTKAARAIFAISVTALFGLVDELHQSATPGRYMEIDDWVADVAGAILAVYVYRGWAGYRHCLELAVFKRKRQATPT